MDYETRLSMSADMGLLSHIIERSMNAHGWVLKVPANVDDYKDRVSKDLYSYFVDTREELIWCADIQVEATLFKGLYQFDVYITICNNDGLALTKWGREVSPFMIDDIRDELQGYSQSILERSLGLGGTTYDVLARLNSEFSDFGHELAANGSQ